MADPSHASVHPHHAQLVNADGSWKYTNALANQTSPYLLQHAHNPVQWYPWGAEAFELARKQNKPIFLSIGYSTCYWCHVMERLVFENPDIAARMNEKFVNIKVDREERPDLDDIYMASVQIFTQMTTGRAHGGWPMSVFLTPPGTASASDPGLKPFFAGTYYPPEPTYQGMPSFPQLVEFLSSAFHSQRDQVSQQAEQLADMVKTHLSQPTKPEDLTKDSVTLAANQLLRMYDARHGGFGSAPKFPQPSNLLFLLHVHRNNPNEKLASSIAYTLQRMATGGMYDQVGGGFHRYSVDEAWLVPHFEKMLYDNGQLVEAYVEAHAMQPFENDPEFYLRVVRETCDYVLREMTDDTGGFWSAQDAEVDALEGGSYLWLPQQVREAIMDGPLSLFAIELYGLNQGTNFQDPHHKDQPAMNVLFLPARLDELAKLAGVSVAEMAIKRAGVNTKLLAARDQRKQPATDDKVLTCWNGIMIAGLAKAGAALNEPRYIRAAARAAEAILKHMRTPDGSLYRTMRRGQPKIAGFLEDYAYFTHGLIELHRATDDNRWSDEAMSLMRRATELFDADAQRSGGYFDTLAEQSDLFVRVCSTYDGAVPSGNSQMVHNLLDLYELTQEQSFFDRAAQDLRAFSRQLSDMGANMVRMQHALLRALEMAPQLLAKQEVKIEPGEKIDRRQALSIDVQPKQIDLSHGPAKVTVKLSIHREYHLNSHNPRAPGVLPTTLELQDADGLNLALRYPKGIERRYVFSDSAVNVYEGEVAIEATIERIGNVPVAAQPKLVLRYQACTNQTCLPAKEIILPVSIRLA